MTEFVLKESEEFKTIPDGEILEAEVSNCEHRETPFDDENNPGQKKWEVSFRFQVKDGEYAGRTVFGNTPVTFTNHPDCKLRVWVQELLGLDSLPGGFRFDTDTLIGLPCRIAVGERVREGKPTKNYVMDVLRSSNVKTAADIF